MGAFRFDRPRQCIVSNLVRSPFPALSWSWAGRVVRQGGTRQEALVGEEDAQAPQGVRERRRGPGQLRRLHADPQQGPAGAERERRMKHRGDTADRHPKHSSKHSSKHIRHIENSVQKALHSVRTPLLAGRAESDGLDARVRAV